jgi:hypothetical protein
VFFQLPKHWLSMSRLALPRTMSAFHCAFMFQGNLRC